MDEFDFDSCIGVSLGSNTGYAYEATNGEIIICSEPGDEWTYIYENTEQKRIEELSKLSYKQLQKLNKADRTAVMRFRSKQGRKRRK